MASAVAPDELVRAVRTHVGDVHEALLSMPATLDAHFAIEERFQGWMAAYIRAMRAAGHKAHIMDETDERLLIAGSENQIQSSIRLVRTEKVYQRASTRARSASRCLAQRAFDQADARLFTDKANGGQDWRCLSEVVREFAGCLVAPSEL